MSKIISIKELNSRTGDKDPHKILDEACSDLVNIANNIIDKIILDIDDSFIDNLNKRLMLNADKKEYSVKIYEISSKDNNIMNYVSTNVLKYREYFHDYLCHFITNKNERVYLYPISDLDKLTLMQLIYAFKYRIEDVIKSRESDIKYKLRFGEYDGFYNINETKTIYIVFNW